MIDNRTRNKAATKHIQISPSRHKLLKHLATDRDVSLIEIADEVIAAGVAAINQREPMSAHAPA